MQVTIQLLADLLADVHAQVNMTGFLLLCINIIKDGLIEIMLAFWP